jgi:hypothetical protein
MKLIKPEQEEILEGFDVIFWEKNQISEPTTIAR